MKRNLLTILLSFSVVISVKAQKTDLSSTLEAESLKKDISIIVTGDAANDVLTRDVFILEFGTPVFEQHNLITQDGVGAGDADVSERQSLLGMGIFGFGF